ncbi:MAG TPA: ABC-2 family transporter protein [Anaerolineales bacterium]|nr:ABC-2 family transporter protein [Anaerolineales bacterium]
MRLFIELTKRSLQRQMTYRAAVMAGLITNFFFGFLRMAILVALYGTRTEISGVDVQGAVTYMALTQALIGYLSLFSWYDLMRSIHTGEIAADLLKPLNLFTFWLAQDLGRALLQFVMRGVLIMVAYALFLDLTYPTTLEQLLALPLALVLSWLVSFAWRFLINLAAFWTPNATGIGRFFFILSWFFSGFLMPLRYYPEWVQQISQFTPFPSMLNTVLDLYVGVLHGPDLWQALVTQAVWIVFLFGTAQIILRAGVKRLVILGG